MTFEKVYRVTFRPDDEDLAPPSYAVFIYQSANEENYIAAITPLNSDSSCPSNYQSHWYKYKKDNEGIDALRADVENELINLNGGKMPVSGSITQTSD